jgi:iduronate 2-sulfatase
MKLSHRCMILSAGIFAAINGMTMSASKPSVETAEGHPNVLFIIVDDLRPQLGCYGSAETLSPNIDRLASEGMLFDRAYVQVPVCGASRASLMTGLYPKPDRFVTYYTHAHKDAAGVPDIPGHLKAQGYTTISNGKIYHNVDDNTNSWSEVHRPQDFRVYLEPENQGLVYTNQVAFEAADVPDNAYPGGALADKIIGDLHRAKKEGTPFFITAGFTKPHLPFNAPKKYWDLYDPAKIELADNPYKPKGAPSNAMHEWNELRNGYSGIPLEGNVSDELARTLIHGYYACVSYTDAMVGKVLNELDRLGMRDNTVVILMGDHGWQLGEHSLWCKHALFNTSTYTPLMISAPGFKPGQRTDALVEFVDIYPSLCELIGVPLPGHLQGKSFVPLLKNPSEDWKTAVFSRYHGGESVTTDRYSYTEWSDGARMLYDHKKDPDENINVSENPEYAPIVEKMQKLLLEHRNDI